MKFRIYRVGAGGEAAETVAKAEHDAIVAELATAKEEHAAAKAHAHDKNLGFREKVSETKSCCS